MPSYDGQNETNQFDISCNVADDATMEADEKPTDINELCDGVAAMKHTQ